MKMIKIMIPFLLVFSVLFSKEYMLDGRLYPETSYVIVNDEGWKIHYNQDGRVVNMTPPGSHNVEMGKYSFDKFGNLIPYVEYAKDNNNKDDSASSGDVDKKGESINVDFSIKDIDIGFSGMFNMSIGDNIAHYPMGYGAGINLTWKKIKLSFGYKSFAADNGILQANIDDYNDNLPAGSTGQIDFDGSGLNLTATSFILSYPIRLFNISFDPGVGMISHSGVFTKNQGIDGSDLAISFGIGYPITSKIDLGFEYYGTISTIGGRENAKGNFIGFGINYSL